MQGGDTDTNACIVGGLIGAAVGIQNIPKSIAEKVIKYNKKKGIKRPDWLYPEDRIFAIIEKIYTNAPKILTIIE